MTPSHLRTRRQFLMQNAHGIGGIALAWLLREENLLATPHLPRDERTFDLTPIQLADLEKGRLYVQVHSEKAPDGNLWGWLLPQEKR